MSWVWGLSILFWLEVIKMDVLQDSNSMVYDDKKDALVPSALCAFHVCWNRDKDDPCGVRVCVVRFECYVDA